MTTQDHSARAATSTPEQNTPAAADTTHGYSNGSNIRPTLLDSFAKRIFELLIGAVTIVGLGLIIASVFTDVQELKILFQSIGLSLFPAGVVAFLLSRFAAKATEALLVDTLTGEVGRRMDGHMRHIKDTVERGLINVESDLEKSMPIIASCTRLGLEDVQLTRSIQLDRFAWFLDAETKKQKEDNPRVWIASSSLKGFVEAATDHFDGRRMLASILGSKCDFRVLMTDPEIADLRANQEGVATGAIPKEIINHLSTLKKMGAKRESVRFYKGTPTVFTIITSDRMLLNPYPYVSEAFRCFCIVVHKTLTAESDIFHQYLHHHFLGAWDGASEVPHQMWDNLKAR